MPTVIIAGINPDINNSNETSYGPVSGDCSEDGEDVDVVFTDSSTPTANTISVTTACSSGNWAITVQDLSGFVDGVVVITADHSDSLGNSATQAVDNVNKVDAADPAEIVFDIFGAPIDYWEDGFRHFCLKLNSTELSCTSGYAAADGDWSTILGAGVTIDRIFVLEATVYVVDSDGDIWSFAQTSIDQRPVGRTGSFSVPAKMSFPSSVGEVVSIAGHHFNACVTFDSGQVWCWHDESTAPVQQIISSAELSIGGFTHHCYIDTVNDLYCSAHDRGETGLPFDISPSLEGSNVVGYVSNHFFDSTFMSFPVSGNPSSLAMYSDGTVSTSFSEDRVGSVQAGFFHSGPGRAVAGNNAANSMRYIAFISFNGQLVHQTQTSSMVVNSSLGNSNLDVGFSYRFNASTVKVSVLRDDGTIYVDDDFTVLNTSSPSFGGSLYNDFIALKAHSMDICGVRANNDIYCAGAYSGGTIASPVFMGTYSP